MDLTELGLNELLPAARGVAAPRFVRNLTEADLPAARVARRDGDGSQISIIKRLHYRHHSLAMLIAEGRPNTECALITGYDPARVSLLKSDPAFQELIAYYKAQKEAAYLNIHERLATLGISAMEELQARIDENPETFANKSLLEIMESALEHSGKVEAPGQAVRAAGVAVTVTFVQPPQAAPEPQDVTDLEIDPE